MLRYFLAASVLVATLPSTHVEAVECTAEQQKQIIDLLSDPQLGSQEGAGCMDRDNKSIKCSDFCKEAYTRRSDKYPDCEVDLTDTGVTNMQGLLDGYNKICTDVAEDDGYIRIPDIDSETLKEIFPNTATSTIGDGSEGDDQDQSASETEDSDNDDVDDTVSSIASSIASQVDSQIGEDQDSESGSEQSQNGSGESQSESVSSQSESESESSASSASESGSESDGAASIQLQAGISVAAITTVAAFIM